MSRRSFIESHGATCDNWQWSWSFVNHDQRFVIFGAWEEYRQEHGSLILSENWVFNPCSHKRNAAYGQSRAHIRLVEEQGYALKTFPMIMANLEAHKRGDEVARIDRFLPELVNRPLVHVGVDWFAA